MAIPLDRSVLIVEDSASAMELLVEYVQKLGFAKILKATDGQQAIDVLHLPESKEIGLILADWNMPVMTGIDLLKSVRALPVHKKTPFVLITADSEMEMIVEAIATGVNSYIVKPVTFENLRSKLEGVFEALKKSV